MRRVFLDTSALVKFYRNEPNSALVRACLVTGDDLLISELTPLEFDAACLAWVRQGLVVESDARRRMSAFAADLPNSFVWATLTPWKLGTPSRACPTAAGTLCSSPFGRLGRCLPERNGPRLGLPTLSRFSEAQWIVWIAAQADDGELHQAESSAVGHKARALPRIAGGLFDRAG
jgi:hypothetical protein